MNTMKMAQAAGTFAGSLVKAASGAQKAGQYVATGAQKMVQHTEGAIDKASSVVGTASGIVQKTNGVITDTGALCKSTGALVESSLQAMQEAQSAKDAFVKQVAQTKMNKNLGLNKASTVQGQMEAIRQEKIDPEFTSTKGILQRIKDVFIPTEFPSGKKVPLGKAQVNEISYNLEKGNKTSMTIKSPDGDVITFKIKAKPVDYHHEPGYLADLSHTLPNGEVERARSLYLPHSSEIRYVAIDTDGQKTVTNVLGNAEGGFIKSHKKK